MKILFTFPGQGAQQAGMLHQLPAGALTTRYMSQACDCLQEDILALDSAAMLQRSTRAVQICLLITGVVSAAHLQQQGVVADITCGLSIGAFPAAVVAGALDFADAVKLVALRGELMQQAYPQGYGLAAIIGLRQAQLESLLRQVNRPALPVFLANINAEDQLVIAGSDEALAQVMMQAKSLGAQKTHRLAVAVPSHCALLDKPAAQLAAAMQQVKLQRPTCAYLSSSSARVYWQAEQIADDLAFNMARTVNWHDSITAAYQREVRLAVEMPPGSVLTGLTSRVMEQGVAVSLADAGQQTVSVLAHRLASY
jgi:malonate decarboxylase epsilon subunit